MGNSVVLRELQLPLSLQVQVKRSDLALWPVLVLRGLQVLLVWPGLGTQIKRLLTVCPPKPPSIILKEIM